MEVVEYSPRRRVALVHLNRPERLNAVDRRADRAAGGRAGPRRPPRAPGSWCSPAAAGRSAPATTSRSPSRSRPRCRPGLRLEAIQEVTRLVRRFPGPVVAAVHGYALGAGCEFALACDVVVATEDAQFGFPEVGVGLSVTGGISRLLPMLVGWAKAKELLLLGERVTGAEAGADRAGGARRTAR